MTVLNVILSLNYFFYKSAAIIVSYVEIHHKTAFEAKSLDFLAFCLISLILTEMFSYIIEFVIVYMYMYKSQTREGGGGEEF